MSTGLAAFSCPIVEFGASVWVAEQKDPNPWVGNTSAASGSIPASLRAEACCARTRSPVCWGPSRSGRPVAPYSSEPPEKTAIRSPVPAST